MENEPGGGPPCGGPWGGGPCSAMVKAMLVAECGMGSPVRAQAAAGDGKASRGGV